MSENMFFDFEKAALIRKDVEARLEKLSSGEKDVYIMGAGIYADRLTELFKKHNIVVKARVVDDDYAAKIGEQSGIISLSEAVKRDNMSLIFAIGGGYSDWYFEKVKTVQEAVDKCKNSDFYAPSDYWMADEGYLTHDVLDVDFVKEHIEEFQQTYDMLEDELSKNVMAEFIYAALGHDATGLAALGTGGKYDYDLDLIFGECRDGVVIECGAFDGKSVVEMSEYTEDKYDMIALECEEENYIKCCDMIKNHPNIKALKLGVWDKKAKLAMVQSKDASYLVEVSDDEKYDSVVKVTDIDSLVGNDPVAAIIMDIEGSELKALVGAKEAITRGTNLAVRVYHKKEDMITIPQYIKSLNDSYKFYIRFNRGANMCRMGDETTLYAVYIGD